MQLDQVVNFKQSSSVKGRLLLLLMVMILPFIVFSIFQAHEKNNRLEAEAQVDSLRLAKDVARDIDDYIVSTGEFLIPIADNKDVRTQNYPVVEAWLKEIWPKYPFYSNIVFVDVNGDIQAAGRPRDEGSEKVNVSDTVYYRWAIRSNSVSVGEFMHSKLSDNPAVHVTYPVFDLSGKRVGFVAAAFDLTKLQDKLMQSNIPQHTLVAVLDNKGIMIARSAEPEKWVGKDHSQRMGFKEMLGTTAGMGKTKNPDGSTRVFGFAAASKVPWYVRVGVDEKYIQNQLKGDLINQFAVFIPLLLIAFFGWLRVGGEVGRLHKRTEYLSLVDPLTELWNYRKFDQDFDREFSHAMRYGEQLSFAMIDVDHFKHYNDHNGHQLGDGLLCSIAGVIRNTIRNVDSVYRYGGEEMCVLLPATDSAGATSVAERIRVAIEKASFIGEENQPLGKLTISIGVSSYPRNATSKEDLVRSADIALYRAKNNGRNRVEAYNEDEPHRDHEGPYYLRKSI